MLAQILKTKLQIVRGNLRSSQSGRHRAPLFITLSALFCVMLFRSTRWVVLQALEVQPVGPLLVQKMMAVTLLIFLGLLLFSNLVTAFSTFYLADELDFLLGHPISAEQLFIARFGEAMAQSSWALLVFGMPAFFGIGAAMDAPWIYYPALFIVLLPFAAIPTGLASLLALLATNMLSADRMRDAAMALGVLALGLIFAVLRAFRIEQLMRPDSFDSVGEIITLLTPPKVSYLPSDWAVSALNHLLFFEGGVNAWPIALLYSTPLALFFIAAWTHRRWYIRGFSRVQEGRHGKSLLDAMRDQLLTRQRARQGSIEARLDAIAAQGRPVSAFKQLMRKDMVIFTRDASQWSNLLVVLAMMTIYLVNYKYFQTVSDTKIVGDVGLYFFNLGVCSFVVVALSGRFLFPAISLEGRSFWVLLQAPISIERLLFSKWLGAAAPVLITGQIMIWASNLLVLERLHLLLIGSAVMLFLSLGIAALAIGFGALYPQLHNPNASSVASSFGAIIFMISAVMMSVLSLAFLFRPITVLGHMLDGKPMSVSLGLATATIIGLAIPMVSARVMLGLGAASLRKRL